MYKTRWSLFQVLHCVKTIQKVCRPVSDFLQVGLPRGRSYNYFIVKNDWLAFRTNSFRSS